MPKFRLHNSYFRIRTALSLRRRGQVGLELVAGIIGTLALLVAAIEIWAWLDRNLVLRQEAFQATRVAAASDWQNPGQPVPFTREPLDIFRKRAPGLPRGPQICTPEQRTQAQALMAQAQELYGQASAVRQQMAQVAAQIQQLAQQPGGDLGQLSGLIQQYADLAKQAGQLSAQAGALVHQAKALCRTV